MNPSENNEFDGIERRISLGTPSRSSVSPLDGKKYQVEQKEAAKKQLKRARKALREAATKAGLEGVSAVKIEDLCELCSIEESTPVSITRLLELADLVASIKGGSAEALPLLEREVAAAKGKSPVEEAGPGPGAPSALLQQWLGCARRALGTWPAPSVGVRREPGRRTRQVAMGLVQSKVQEHPMWVLHKFFHLHNKIRSASAWTA